MKGAERDIAFAYFKCILTINEHAMKNRCPHLPIYLLRSIDDLDDWHRQFALRFNQYVPGTVPCKNNES